MQTYTILTYFRGECSESRYCWSNWIWWTRAYSFLHNHPAVEQIDLFTSSEEGVQFSSKFGHLVKIADTPLQKIAYDTLAKFDVVLQVHHLG